MKLVKAEVWKHNLMYYRQYCILKAVEFVFSNV